jgi:hypothetical protein
MCRILTPPADSFRDAATSHPQGRAGDEITATLYD